MTERPAIAVLMTCHNRRARTLECLQALAAQPEFDAVSLFLVDDGSRDGTGDAVRAMFSEAQVIAADGTLFWSRGMRLAWNRAKAAGKRFDFYLWLNDDVLLDAQALATLLADAAAVAPRGGAVVLAGATRDPATGAITYGAHRRDDPRRPLRMRLLEPGGVPLAADTISGNVVLVSAAAEARLGNLDPAFEHIYSDLDYGLRARAAGIPVALASRALATCADNPLTGSSLDPALGRLARLRAAWREQDRVHARDWRRFVARHGGHGLAPLAHRLAPFLRILVGRPHPHGARC